MRWIGIAVCMGGLLLAACGDGESDSDSTPPPATSSTTTAAVTTTAAATTTSEAAPSAAVGWSAPPLGGTCDAARPHDAGLSRYSLISGDTERSYLVHVPTGYDGSAQWPVIVALHGKSITAQEWFDLVWRGIAEELGYVLVLPDALARDWADRTRLPDVPFIAGVVDGVTDRLCVDESRIYATGGSDGADMVTRLACDLSDRFAAVRPYIGGNYPGLFETEDCGPSRAVPATSFIGTAEPFYDLGVIRDRYAAWAERNGCDATPVVEEISPGQDVTRYQGCSENASVELFLLQGIEHTAVLADCTGTEPGFCAEFPLDMTAVMVEFFEAHPMPAHG